MKLPRKTTSSLSRIILINPGTSVLLSGIVAVNHIRDNKSWLGGGGMK